MAVKPQLERNTDLALRAIRRRENISVQNQDFPLWLNSFPSVCVPSCYLDIIDPKVLNHVEAESLFKIKEGRRKTVNVSGEILQDEAFEFNKRFQRKVLTFQVICSSFIILLSIATSWCLHEGKLITWNYNQKTLFPTEKAFNILTCLLSVMTSLSVIFFKNIDIFDICRLNIEDRKRDTAAGKPLRKILVVLSFTALLSRSGQDNEKAEKYQIFVILVQ